MKLLINCKNCNEHFNVKASVITRSELEDKWGRYFKKQCTNCLSTREYHVNEVQAEMDKREQLYVAIIFSVIAIIFAFFLRSMGRMFVSIAVALPIIVISYYAAVQKEKISVFNRIMIKRDE